MTQSHPSEPKPTLAQRFRATPITFVLAALNLAWFVWAEQHGSTNDIDVLLRFGAVEPMHVHAGQYWRVASYMFLHIGWAHLLLNTWAGMSWCVAVERMLGSWRFLLVYMLAGIGGGVSCVLFSNAVTAGASGAMFGIIGALLAIRYKMLGTLSKFVADRGVRSTAGQIALWTVIGIVAIPMSQAGHFGGLFIGGLATLIMLLPQHRAPAWLCFAIAFTGITLVAFAPWKLIGPPAARGDIDFSKVKIGRLGIPNDSPEQHADTYAIQRAAPLACDAGNQRACVIDALASIDPDHNAKMARAFSMFEANCKAGDQDACAGEGFLIVTGVETPPDAGEDLRMMYAMTGSKLLKDACANGSEYACEFPSPF